MSAIPKPSHPGYRLIIAEHVFDYRMPINFVMNDWLLWISAWTKTFCSPEDLE